MVSVIIPLYNKEKSVLDTIHSVLAQTYADFELLIVNDGSKDKSLEIVQGIIDNRITIIDKPNGGVSSARNTGIKVAKNEYIAFLDGDDIWHPKHLQILLSAISEFDNDQIGGAGTTFYKSNSKQFDESKFAERKPKLIEDYFAFMSSPVPRFNSSTLLVKKTKIMETGLFNENLKYGEDVEFWYRLFSKYQLIYAKTCTTIYFVAAENRSVDYIMPIEKRFHIFNYKNKSASEKTYLDKLVALIIIDYYSQKAYLEALLIIKMYFSRSIGLANYVFKLLKKK